MAFAGYCDKVVVLGGEEGAMDSNEKSLPFCSKHDFCFSNTRRDLSAILVVSILPVTSTISAHHLWGPTHLQHCTACALSSSSSLPRREHPLPMGHLSEGSCSAHGSWTRHFHHWIADMRMTPGKVLLTLADFILSCLLNFLNAH